MITSQIIADSINPRRVRLTTMLLTYPRFIHAEIMTHRAFSRNAASSRAIPIHKILGAVDESPAEFEFYGSNKPGMRAGEELNEINKGQCKLAIHKLKHEAMHTVAELEGWGLHKQCSNRYLEPWMHISVIVSATEAGMRNFFALRAHPDAQPEFQVLAYRTLKQYLENKPRELYWGQWHIPYQPDPQAIYTGTVEANKDIIRAAVGRMARISYLRQDNEDIQANQELHDKMQGPGHWSPFEHVARAAMRHPVSNFDSGYHEDDRPLSGWHQYRKNFTQECKTLVSLEEIMAKKPEHITV